MACLLLDGFRQRPLVMLLWGGRKLLAFGGVGKEVGILSRCDRIALLQMNPVRTIAVYVYQCRIDSWALITKECQIWPCLPWVV